MSVAGRHESIPPAFHRAGRPPSRRDARRRLMIRATRGIFWTSKVQKSDVSHTVYTYTEHPTFGKRRNQFRISIRSSQRAGVERDATRRRERPGTPSHERRKRNGADEPRNGVATTRTTRTTARVGCERTILCQRWWFRGRGAIEPTRGRRERYIDVRSHGWSRWYRW